MRRGIQQSYLNAIKGHGCFVTETVYDKTGQVASIKSKKSGALLANKLYCLEANVYDNLNI